MNPPTIPLRRLGRDYATTMTDQPTNWSRIANGLVKAIQTPTDELAAKKGEGDLMVKIKRNSDRLKECPGHEFERQPDWRASPLYNQNVRCLRCGGEMKTHGAMIYMRGFAHGAGVDYSGLVETVWPKGAESV